MQNGERAFGVPSTWTKRAWRTELSILPQHGTLRLRGLTGVIDVIGPTFPM